MLDEKPVQKTLTTAPGNSKVSNHTDLSKNVIKTYLKQGAQYFLFSAAVSKKYQKVNLLTFLFLI